MENSERFEPKKPNGAGKKKRYLASGLFLSHFVILTVAALAYAFYSSSQIQSSARLLADLVEKDLATINELDETRVTIEQTREDVEDLEEQVQILELFSANE